MRAMASRAPLAVLVLGLLGAAPSRHSLLADRSTQQLSFVPTSYLAVSTGRVFRVIWKGPVTDSAGAKIGSKLTYLGDSRDHAVARHAADELMLAMGPQFQMDGETHVVVLEMLDFVPSRAFNLAIGYPITFSLQDGRWRRVMVPPERTKTIGSGPIPSIDDPAYPFDPAALAAAAHVAEQWMAALDAGNAGALLAKMSDHYAAEVSANGARFERFVASRAGPNSSAAHRELYRMQAQANPSLPGGRGVLVMFDVQAGSFGHALEQVGLAQERGQWRVWNFVSQSFKKSM